MASNLPPGVSPSMIPGNRPEDEAWDQFHAQIDVFCAEEGIDPEQAQLIWKMGASAFQHADQHHRHVLAKLLEDIKEMRRVQEEAKGS